MRIAPLLAVVGCVALVGGACAKRLMTRFPHVVHLAEMDCGGPGKPQCLSCPSCHKPKDELTWEKPKAEMCGQCHESTSKYSVTTPPPGSVRSAAYSIIFPHDEHLQMSEFKGQCIRCHSGAVGFDDGPPLFPRMGVCLECHEHKREFENNQCDRCHEARHLRALKPSSFLSHDIAWTKRHAVDARSQPQTCALCHAQTQCDGCHDSTQGLRPEQKNPESVSREFVHRFDFMTRHAIEAKSQPGQCFTCHVRNECDACHTQRGVSGGAFSPRSPHEFGWSSGTSLELNQHGREARRDVASCAACHDQGPATNCVRCHRPGAIGGTPHPSGWRSSEAPHGPGCSACHGGR